MRMTFTWGAFGNCCSSLNNIQDIELLWFPESPIKRARIYDIWKRHPQQATPPGIDSTTYFVDRLPYLFLISLRTIIFLTG